MKYNDPIILRYRESFGDFGQVVITFVSSEAEYRALLEIGRLPMTPFRFPDPNLPPTAHSCLTSRTLQIISVDQTFAEKCLDLEILVKEPWGIKHLPSETLDDIATVVSESRLLTDDMKRYLVSTWGL